MVNEVMKKATSVSKKLIGVFPAPNDMHPTKVLGEFYEENIGQGRGLYDIPNYENNYQITTDGKVWNKKRKKWLAQSDLGRGWLKVELWKDGKRKNIKVHRLVAMTFIPNPYNKPAINHIDCNKQNNHVSNLEWVTFKENTNHAIKHGLMFYQKGSNNV